MLTLSQVPWLLSGRTWWRPVRHRYGLKTWWEGREGGIREIFQILYCVDSSAPERIGNAPINLVELLHQPSIQSAPVLIVFTKTDLKSARTLNELKSLMRLEDIKQHSNQEINVLEFNTEDETKLGPVLDWCIRFKTVQFQYMNGNAY